MNDFGNTRILLSVKSLIAVLLCIITLVGTAMLGYFRLDQKANAGVENKRTLEIMQCDIRQLKNFMVYGVKPNISDRCER